jgi:glycine/D-amino acid oxidase-like deaminating enzyme
MRVTVVGAGIMGLCTAWALERRGHTVTVVDQAQVPNPLGSSIDHSRLLRQPYGAERGYTAMVPDALAAWDRLWQDLGTSLYVPTGTLVLGSRGTRWVGDSAETLAALGVAVDRLDRDALARRYPLIHPEFYDEGFEVDSGGVLLAGRIVELLAHRLVGDTVSLWPRLAVRGIDPDRGTVDLADGRTLEADRVVVAAGPWTPRLLPELAARLTATRQVYIYVSPSPDMMEAWRGMPMILDIDPERGFYLVPPVKATAIKIGDHRPGVPGSPDEARDLAPEKAAELFTACRARLTAGERFWLADGHTCFYTMAPEDRFVVEPAGSRAWVLAGFSGHGFKFAPLIAERVAAVLDDAADPEALTAWAAGCG